mmetsp:Transcript_32318/g.48749  ORF Transcript_32318/g.48749 Transcript_32318/m.48749 type:complete len:280 (-) Transcript_32318:1204-2043(-)
MALGGGIRKAFTFIILTGCVQISDSLKNPKIMIHMDQATVLTKGTASLPPMMSIPCSGILKEIIKPPSVDDLYEWYLTQKNAPEADPSWAVLWPTACSLGQFLIENPSVVGNRHVIELGCGLALSGLIASSLGAKSVIISDREPFALHCALSTAAVNNINVQASIINWEEEKTLVDSAEVVLASDVLYDKSSIDAFARVCLRLLLKDGVVLVTDPKEERCPGAREQFCELMKKHLSIEIIELPMLDCEEGEGIDSRDHALRMKEPTVLLKCTPLAVGDK